MIAGPQHSVLGQGTGFGIASYFFLYKEEFENQAARLASQLLAGARANQPPERFHAVQARLRDMPTSSPMPPATVTGGTDGRVGVAVPSGATRAVTAGDSLLLSVPSNWTRVSAGTSMVFAPDGGLLKTPGGALTMTHGIQAGVGRSPTGDLQRDTQMLLETLSRAGSNIRWTPSYQATTLARRRALTTSLLNVSAITGTFEQVLVCVAHLPGGSMLYLIGLSPLDESSIYRLAFDRVRESFQLVR